MTNIVEDTTSPDGNGLDSNDDTFEDSDVEGMEVAHTGSRTGQAIPQHQEEIRLQRCISLFALSFYIT